TRGVVHGASSAPACCSAIQTGASSASPPRPRPPPEHCDHNFVAYWLRVRAGPNRGQAHRPRASSRISAAPFSAIIIVGALVLPDVIVGITEASTTRKPSRPNTRSLSSTTANESLSRPILAVPTW